ncbi:MAG: O-antigen ligase family protein [Sedimentisphaerales bacterium]|nr:O-antigen ligase family protein [Sedimentisphaerales bacterium]
MTLAQWRAWEGDKDRNRLSQAIEWLLIALLAFSPLAFGVEAAWSEEAVVVLVAIVSICFCVKAAIARDVSVTWTWAYVPILVLIVLATVQMIPLPVSFVGLISPNTVTQKAELLNDLRGTEELPSSVQISFYPYATRHDLRLMLAAAGVFVVVLSVFRRPDQIMRLLLAIAAVGAGVALLALAQDIAGNGRIYWLVTSPHGNALSGPFVNHSHYAQFMNLSIGAALAVLLVKVHEAFGGRTVTPAAVAEYLGTLDGRLIWGLCAMIALGTATIFASLSRGGMVSLMIAGAVTTLVLSFTKSVRGSGWITALIILGAFICVLYVGFDAVYDRLGTLRDLNHVEGGRWQIVKDVAVAWTRFPVMGTGLGTHEVVYPMFDRSTSAAIASHAENEYAQAAEETGAIGLAALFAFAVFVWGSYGRVIRMARMPIHSATYGLGFGLIAIMIHSFSDFGQHLPANGFLSAIFCALMIRLSRLGADDGIADGERTVARRRPSLGGLIALAAVGVVLTWVVLGADAARRGEAHWAKAMVVERDLLEAQWEGNNEAYMDLLASATAAHDCQPDNMKYGYWLNVYRWRAISRLTDPNTGEIVQSAELVSFTERIASELRRTLTRCPTFGPAWCVLGQLERIILGRDEQGAQHIRRGVKLAPCDPTARLVAGILEAEQGRTQVALDHLTKAVTLDGHVFRDIASRLIGLSGGPDLALRVAGDDMVRLNVLVSVLSTSGGSESADEVRNRIAVLLEQKCQDPAAPDWAFAWLASVCQKSGKVAEAIKHYREALAQNCGEVDWRFALAQLLADTGDVREAIQEAEMCLRFRPEHTPSKRLIERLSVDPRVVPKRSQQP